MLLSSNKQCKYKYKKLLWETREYEININISFIVSEH